MPLRTLLSKFKLPGAAQRGSSRSYRAQFAPDLFVSRLEERRVLAAPAFDFMASGVPQNTNPAPILEDAGQQTVQLLNVTDNDGGTQPLGFTATSENPSLIPDPTVTYTSGDPTGELTFTPLPNANGTAVIRVTLADGGPNDKLGDMNDETFQRTFTVTVTSVNDAPSGTNTTITILEDHAHTFTAADFGFSDPDDNPADALSSVRITTLPAAGTLTNDGTAVTAGGTIAVTDITAGKLVFTPATNANGNGYASFTFQVQDDGGTADGGVDLDPTANTLTIDVTSVNDAPSGTDKTVTVLEDHTHVFSATDFGFSDSSDNPANAFNGVRVTTLPGAGTLTNGDTAVAAGETVSATDIAAGNLVFTPATNASGTGYASFTFQVQDDGGTDNGGVDLDPTANTFTINVTSVNDAPSGTDTTITILEDHTHVFAAADFGFTDPDDNPANTFSGVRIATLPGAGALTRNGTAVAAGETIAVAEIGNLVFTPVGNANGAAYASFTFQVQDDGGTADGGVDLDPTANTLTINVTTVNDAPSGTDKTITILEDHTHVFAVADFGFTDPDDNPANAFSGVRIATLPAAGTLTNDNMVLAAGDTIAAADITDGKLVFTPATNANGTGYASFTFQVQDDGGTTDGGVDRDPTANTFTIDVTSVNDAPSGTDKTVTILEDHTHVFSAADFGFSDSNDNPANTFSGVRIAALPAAGALTNDGTAVAGGATVSVADIGDGKLVFTPATNANGTGYASFTFQVQDDGGTANGGVDLDPTANTLTIDVTSVNDAPSGTDTTITILEDHTHVFAAADFGFTDPDDNPADAFSGVRIATLPGAGTLTNDGAAVAAGNTISVADVTAGKLVFTPVADANGTGYASFTFQVQDDGGTTDGGVDLDPTANTLTIDVTAVNDPPSFVKGADQTVLEDAGPQSVAGWATAISAGPANESGQGLTFVVTANDNPGLFAAAPAVAADGTLTYTAADDANGTANISVRLMDDGGTTNGGQNTSPTQTFAINVTPVNDAPTFTLGADQTVDEDAGPQTVTGFASGISAGPSDESGQALTFNVVTNDNPGLFAAAPAITPGGKLSYTPADNANGTANITVVLADDGGTANGGQNTSASRTFAINVTAVNDAPTVMVGGGQTVNEDTSLLLNPITVDDVEAVVMDAPLRVFLSAKRGFLTVPAVPGLTVTDNKTGDVQVEGKPGALNTALKGVTYQGNLNVEQDDVVKVSVSDLGTAGAGGPQTSAVRQIPIDIIPLPDAPTVAPITMNVPQNGDVTFDFLGSDGDPADNPPALKLKYQFTSNAALNLNGFPSGVTGTGMLTNNGDGTATFKTAGQFVKLAQGETATISLNYGATDTTGLGSGDAPITITVLGENDTPVVTSVTPLVDPSVEAQSVPLKVTFADPDTTDLHTATIRWGDGTADTTIGNAAPDFQTSHFYSDDPRVSDDRYHISVVVRDDSAGESQSFAQSVRVNNVAPSLPNLSATPVTAIGQTTVSGTFADPGFADTHVVLINWGDGEVTPISFGRPGGTGAFSATHTFIGNPDRQNPAADIPIEVAVVDDDGGIVRATVAATVPGQGLQTFAIVAAPKTEQVVAPPVPVVEVFVDEQLPAVVLQTLEIQTSRSGLTIEKSDKLELRRVLPSGDEAKGIELPGDDPKTILRGLAETFRKLPPDHYRVYLMRADGTQRLVLDVVLQAKRRSDDTNETAPEREQESPESGAGGQESGVRGQESGVRGQGSGVRGQESRVIPPLTTHHSTLTTPPLTTHDSTTHNGAEAAGVGVASIPVEPGDARGRVASRFGMLAAAIGSGGLSLAERRRRADAAMRQFGPGNSYRIRRRRRRSARPVPQDNGQIDS